MTMKVIGAGFGRTGTASLQIALEKLGFDKCYHMFELIHNRAHAKIWYQASLGEVIDWDDLLQGYQASVDWPACSFYKELLEKYPDAKVVLTVRDVDKWYASARQTIYTIWQIMPHWLLWTPGPLGNMNRLVSAVVWNGTFHNKFGDEKYTKSVFLQHIKEVKKNVPGDKLLIYQVAEGLLKLYQVLMESVMLIL